MRNMQGFFTDVVAPDKRISYSSNAIHQARGDGSLL
jgi:hypothetical protein